MKLDAVKHAAIANQIQMHAFNLPDYLPHVFLFFSFSLSLSLSLSFLSFTLLCHKIDSDLKRKGLPLFGFASQEDLFAAAVALVRAGHGIGPAVWHPKRTICIDLTPFLFRIL